MASHEDKFISKLLFGFGAIIAACSFVQKESPKKMNGTGGAWLLLLFFVQVFFLSPVR